MNKIIFSQLLLLALLSGCKEKEITYGDSGAPRVDFIIDPVLNVKLDQVTVGQLVQLVGVNMRSTKRLHINDIEVPLSVSTTMLSNCLYFNVPRVPRSQQNILKIENDFGVFTRPITIIYPPFMISGMLNEYAPQGTELKLVGESMDLYAEVGVSKVKFGDVSATITSVTETSVSVIIPAGVANKTVVKFQANEQSEEIVCPVRYRDDSFIIENLENKATTRYPLLVVPNTTFPAPLTPTPTEGDQYTRVSGASGVSNMIGNYNLVIPEIYFTQADDYLLKFELCTIRPIAYRLAISLNQGSNFFLFGPASATTDTNAMVSTNGVWKTITIPMDTWKNRGGTKNLRVYIGSQPAGVVYDFCLDNFRIAPKTW